MQTRFLLLLFFLFCLTDLSAQQSFSISGTVKDNKETLPGASIYLSGYKIATVSNNDGKFVLPNLPPGNYEVLVQMIGYLPFSKNIVISDKPVSVNVLLQENVSLLNEVVIKPDPDRAFHLAMFKEYFIGKTPNAKECIILNTEVLNIDNDKTNSRITITSPAFLIVENKALGYRLTYLLQYFQYDYKINMVFYAGHPSFEEMKGSNARQKKWKRNREIAYNGSIQHFFKSLYQNKTTEEGFIINKIARVPNLQRPADSLITANIKRLTTGQTGITNVLTFNGNDSLSYWLKKRKEPKELSIVSRKDVLVDTLVKVVNQDLKTVSYKDELYVSYKNEKENADFNYSGYKQNRPPDLANFQISVVQLLTPWANFYANGAVADPRSLLYKGYWAYEKIADLVPMDYLVTTVKKQ